MLSSLELVSKLIGRYRKVDFHADFPVGGDFSEISLLPLWGKELRNFTYTAEPCRVNLRVADIQFKISFLGSADTKGLLTLCMEGAWEATKEKLLNGKHIVAEPDRPYDNLQEKVPVRFSLEDEQGQKLILPNGLDLEYSFITATWEFFLPKGTPEHKLVCAALEYERNLETYDIGREHTKAAQGAKARFQEALSSLPV